MVFVNGQKFACATCIKGHRSTTCNHGERPLHEIKKKGRPSTQCAHCKELRKAKQVNARCICGREEGSAAVANGLKRAKSLSHDGRLPIPGAIGGEDLLRSVSNQGRSNQDSLDGHASNGGVINCECRDGVVCANCQERAGYVVAKSKNSSRSSGASLKGYSTSRQRSTASLDLGKSGMLLFPRDSASPLPFPPHTHGGQTVHSPDGFATHGMGSTGIYANGSSPLLVQTLSPSGSHGGEHSPSASSSSLGQFTQMQTNVCFDYASSSDYDSDYQPSSSYSYFPDNMSSYAASNASEDLDDMDLLDPVDSKKIMDGIMNGTTTLNPMESPSADEIRMLYSALSTFSTASPPAMPTPPNRSYSSPVPSSSASSIKKGCCGSGKNFEAASSPASSILSHSSHSPSAGGSEIGEDEFAPREGCGCAISPNMCCCGERCACPGCLAYPNNQNWLNANAEASKQALVNGALDKDKDMAIDNDKTLTSAQALNLSAALNLIQNNGPADGSLNYDARQALKQEFSGMGLSGLEAAQMQHPTLMGDNGVLICGCGCGRPTVDCTECFRDMCQFVGEYQAKMKDELDLDATLRRDVGGNRPGLGVNMNMAMSMNMGVDMNMGMTNLGGANFGQAPTMPQTMSLLSMQHQRSDGSRVNSPSYDQQQQQQQHQHQQQPQHQHQHQRQQQQQDQQQQQQAQFNQRGQDFQGGNSLLKQQQQQMQLAQQMQQRLSMRRRFREGMDEEQKLQLQLMEQEQMQLQQLQQSIPGLNHLQLDFLDDEDWSFVDEIRTDEIRTDGATLNLNGMRRQ